MEGPAGIEYFKAASRAIQEANARKPPNCTPNARRANNTAERPMPAWPECMWMTPGLPPIMMSRCKPVQLDF